MAKPYACRPVLRPGKKIYSTTIIDHAGQRRTVSLRTDQAQEAADLCDDLVKLRGALPDSPEHAPVDVRFKALCIYFNLGERDMERRLFEDVDAILLDVDADRQRTAARQLRLTVARLQRELHAEREHRQALERSIVGQLITAGRDCPLMADAYAAFAHHLAATTSPANVTGVCGAVQRFLDELPAERLRPVDITVADVNGFVDRHVAAGEDPAQKAARRDGIRRRIGRFVNWAAAEWQYPSVMGQVPAVGAGALAAERGDIVWHAEAEIEAALQGIADQAAAKDKWTAARRRRHVLYWQAAVASLAYAGLNPVELCWLKLEHLQRAEDFGADPAALPARFWVTVVEDPAGKEGRRRLKTANRRRHVNIHPTRLWPRLQAYLDAGLAGTHFLFPVPADRKRKRTKSEGHPERWVVQSFRKILSGHVRNKAKDKATPGLLPAGMDGETLRHTFGSIRLRDGRTTAEVAAEMGNTEEVVRTNYARILGWEVKP